MDFAMSEMTDDDFMNLGTAPAQPTEMSDDQFMGLGASKVNPNSNASNPQGEQDNVHPSRSTGEEAFRQIGLAGRDLAGAVPMAVAGAGDAVNMGINGVTGGMNKYLGTSIPQLGMPTDDVQKGLSATGVFPEYENRTERNVGRVADTVLGGGEAGYNTAKEAVGNAIDYGRQGINAVSEPLQTVKAGWNALKPENIQSTVSDLQKGTNNVYAQYRSLGAGAGDSEVLRTSVNNALKNTDIIPKLTPVTSDVVGQINAAADNGPLSLNHLDQYRRQLRDASGEDSAAAAAVRKAIDNHVNSITDESGDPNAVALLNRARAEYTRNANLDDVGTILQKSQGDPQKIKTRLTNFLADEDNTRGMTSDEIAALRRASQTSNVEAATKMLGKAGFTILPTGGSGNGIFPYAALAAENGARAGTAFIPHAWPLVTTGTAAKAYNTLYGRGLGQQAFDLIKDREMPAMPDMSPTEVSGLLERPDIKVPPEPTSSPYQTQRQLPKPGYNPFTPENIDKLPPPSPATAVPPEGFGAHYKPQNLNSAPAEMYSPNQTPILAGDKNWRYNPYADSFSVGNSPNLNEQNRGGAIKKLKTGRVYAKPKSYSVLENRAPR